MTKERRIHPRFNTDFSAQLSLDSRGETHRFQVRSINISQRSIQVQGGQELVDAFIAQQEYPHSCKLSFTLPGEKQSIKVRCHMVTHRRLSQDVFYLALGFIEFDGDGYSVLEHHLLSQRPCGIDRLNVPTPSTQAQRMRA